MSSRATGLTALWIIKKQISSKSRSDTTRFPKKSNASLMHFSISTPAVSGGASRWNSTKMLLDSELSCFFVVIHMALSKVAFCLDRFTFMPLASPGLLFVDCFFGIGTRFLSQLGKTLPRRTNKCAYPVLKRRIEMV